LRLVPQPIVPIGHDPVARPMRALYVADQRQRQPTSRAPAEQEQNAGRQSFMTLDGKAVPHEPEIQTRLSKIAPRDAPRARRRTSAQIGVLMSRLSCAPGGLPAAIRSGFGRTKSKRRVVGSHLEPQPRTRGWCRPGTPIRSETLCRSNGEEKSETRSNGGPLASLDYQVQDIRMHDQRV